MKLKILLFAATILFLSCKKESETVVSFDLTYINFINLNTENYGYKFTSYKINNEGKTTILITEYNRLPKVFEFNFRQNQIEEIKRISLKINKSKYSDKKGVCEKNDGQIRNGFYKLIFTVDADAYYANENQSKPANDLVNYIVNTAKPQKEIFKTYESWIPPPPPPPPSQKIEEIKFVSRMD